MSKKHGFFIVIRLWLRRVWSILIFAVAISNFVLACTASRSLQTRTIYSTVTNEIHHVSVVTQILTSVSSSSSPSSSSPHPDSSSDNYFQPLDHPTFHYRYMLINGVKAVMLFGRLHYVGSRTSYGRIVDIFPDRVILDSGDTISNENLKGKINERGTVFPVAGGVGRDQ